jgi:hypothetical protein
MNSSDTVLQTVRKRFYTTYAVVAALTLVMPLQAFASSADFENDTTGANSTNTNSVSASNTANFSISSNGTVNNTVTLNADTGNNTVTNNTTVGDVSTGDIEFDIAVDTTINKIDPDSLQGFGQTSDFTITSSNHNTGANSTNDNTSSVTNSSNVSLTQNGTVNNNVTGNFSTGGNTISGNTTVGDISTGDITGKVSINNDVNGVGGGNDEEPVGPPKPGDKPIGGGSIFPSIPSLIPVAQAAAPAKPAIQAKKEFFPAGTTNAMPLYFILVILALAFLLDREARAKNRSLVAVAHLLSGRYSDENGYALVRVSQTKAYNKKHAFRKEHV